MEMIIGRDAETSRLKILVGQKPYMAGERNSVPKTVSRKHCSITQQDGGMFLIKNLEVENITYVNGLPIEKKFVNEKDKIELGPEHYLLNWDILKKVLPPVKKEVDIRHLKNLLQKTSN